MSFNGNVELSVSKVTDLILVTATDVDSSAHRRSPSVGHLNAYLRAHHERSMCEVNDYCGGDKYMQCDVFIAAINYLDIPAFLKAFHSITWECPESVQLMIKGEDDDLFTIYRPGSDL
jgi:hypothetical protein